MHDTPQYRKAFIQYLRRGTPISISLKATQLRSEGNEPSPEHPTDYYVWRTAGDDKVRSAHGANNGRIFSWQNPPESGHPGEDYNCRCWAEPYYERRPNEMGDPKLQTGNEEFQYFNVHEEGKETPNRINIFFGGALDLSSRIVVDSPSLTEDISGHNYYLTHDNADRAVALIDALPEGVQVNLVGHSLGGATAAQVALARPQRITLLATIDPVGEMRIGRDPVTHTYVYAMPDNTEYAKIANSVDKWVNVQAAPDTQHEDDSDDIAEWGDQWAKRPLPYAHVFMAPKINHGKFEAMMNYNISGHGSVVDFLSTI